MHLGSNTRNKIALILVFLVIFLIPLQAVGEGLGNFTILQAGQEAPYAGYLFDIEATAKVVNDFKFLKVEFDLEKDFALKQTNSEWTFKHSLVQSKLTFWKERYTKEIGIKNTEIEELRAIAIKNPNSYAQYWFAGGILTGILTAIAAYYSVSSINKN